MRRRDFVTLLGGAVVALPLAARAQQQQPAVPRVGYVSSGVRGTDVYYQTGFRQELADLGYVVGRNLVLEERYADGKQERIPALIAELLTLNVDVLVTPGTPTSQAAQRATSTVPIVCMSGDPVRAGLVSCPTRQQHHRLVATLRRLRRQVAGTLEGGGTQGASCRCVVES